MSPSHAVNLTALRLSVLAMGYVPIPVTSPDYKHPKVKSPGKQPFFKGWQNVSADTIDAQAVENWTRDIANHPNTGLLCGHLVGLDIDVPAEELSAEMMRLASAMLGVTPLHRIGNAPKILLCYRTATPMRKMETPELKLDSGATVQIEVMGVGQQVVGFGVHPTTGNPYTWPNGTPERVPLADLPMVAEPALRTFLAAAEAVLRQAGGLTDKERAAATEPARPAEPTAARPARPAGGKQARGSDFFRDVNTDALGAISSWLPTIFPKASRQEGTGAWRISSADLGRQLEEDISVHPTEGGHDFGTRQSCSPIDIVQEHGNAPDAKTAAFWLCEKLGKAPTDLGWKQAKEGKPQTAPDYKAAPVAAPRLDDTEAGVAAVVERFNALYLVVNEAGKAVILQPSFDPVLRRRRFDRLSPRDLQTLYMNERIKVGEDDDRRPIFKTAADLWLRHPERRQFIQGVTFDPTGSDNRPGVLNLWEGFAMTPKAGDWSLMRNHIRVHICADDPVRFTYLMGWMARLLQHPAEQGEVAVVMRGGEGTGKGTLARALREIIGHHALAISNAKHLVGNFNAHLRDTVFLFADEAFFAGDRAHVGVLKSIITEPCLTIEGKFQNAIETPNFLHLMMASNEEWVVPAALDARRFLVLEVSEAVKNNHEYFGALWQQMGAGGYAAMLHDLLAYDLSSFNVRAVPTTAGLQQQQKLSLPTTESWWQDCLARGYVFRSKLGLEKHFGGWLEEVSTELLFASYTEFAERRRERHLLSREMLGRFMRKMGAQSKRLSLAWVGEHLTDSTNSFGGSQRFAAAVEHPRPSGYSLGSLKDAREGFAEATGLTNEWGEA